MTPAPHDMPVLDAFPVSEYPGHWEARFPDGVRTYPSRDAIRLAAARIGAAVRYHDQPLRSGPPSMVSGAIGVTKALTGAAGTLSSPDRPSPQPVRGTARGRAIPVARPRAVLPRTRP